MIYDVDELPIIESGALQHFIIGRESERAYQMKRCVCCRTSTCDISRIGISG